MSNVTFYTTNFLNNSPSGSSLVSSPSTDIKHLFDKNLNTYWECDPPNAAVIFFDTRPQDENNYLVGNGETSGSFDAISLWINNYNTDFSDVDVVISDTWDYVGNNLTAKKTTKLTHSAGPLWFVDLDSATTQRFIMIQFSNWPAGEDACKISWAAVHDKRTIQTRPRWPISITPEYYIDTIKMRGGKEYVSEQAGNYTEKFAQSYKFLSTANKTAFDNVFHDSHSSLYPLIYQPGTSVTDAYFCKITHNALTRPEVYKGYYTATLNFKTIPYIKDGENF